MTQIATNKNQSARLIACGVDPQSADMCYNGYFDSLPLDINRNNATKDSKYIPAWSLSALLALLPPTIPTEDKDVKYQLMTLYQLEDNKYYAGYILGRGDRIYDCIGEQSASTFFDAILELTIWYINNKDKPETTRKNMQNLSLTEKQNVEAKDSMKETKDYPPYLDCPKTIVPNKKEKELNLFELLKGFEGEKFYSLIDGEVKLKQLTDDVICQYHKYHRCGYLLGCSLDGVCQLYPSRALYEKYPLDPYSAWMEWKESKKPKHILQAEIRLISNDGKTIVDFECIELKVSDTNLAQAAQGVREYLMNFHKANTTK